MQLNNKIIIAAAGAGKTTEIVRRALDNPKERALITTYTINNEAEIRKIFATEVGYVPNHVRVQTWFSFLLRELVRPYQNGFYSAQRVDGLAFVDGRSAFRIPEANIAAHYFSDRRNIYSDKISKFAYRCNETVQNAVIERLGQIYDHIYIDEVQDLAGWDIDILELLLNSKITTTIVGDYRQSTYRTNHASKNQQFSGVNIIKKFEAWQKAGMCQLEEMLISHRCNQSICNFSDCFFPDAPRTKSDNFTDTGHDGVFIISSNSVAKYIERFDPKVLRYDRGEKCQGFGAINFGDAKGQSHDRTLVFPHGPFREVIKTGDFSPLKEPSKLYVAMTRARYSVAIVYDGKIGVGGVTQI